MFSGNSDKVRFSQVLLSSRDTSPAVLDRTRLNKKDAARSCSRPVFLGLLIFFLTVPALIVLGGVIFYCVWKPTLSQITISTDIRADFCGASPAEARAAGCRFEVNNFAWLHPDCYDEELDKDWTSGPLAGDLEFWEEYGGKGVIPFDRVMAGDIKLVWVNTRQHRRHCLFVWEKYQRAAMNMRPMDNWTVDYLHTKHCINLLRDPKNETPDDMVSSYLTLKYPTCEYGPIQLAIKGQQTGLNK